LSPTEQVSHAVSIREFAKFNGVCESTIRRMIRSGQLPAYRIGSVFRIPLRTLETMQRGGYEHALERLIADAPPLTDEQRNRISALLRVGS
jgi:excisionase family DNA binding protein